MNTKLPLIMVVCIGSMCVTGCSVGKVASQPAHVRGAPANEQVPTTEELRARCVQMRYRLAKMESLLETNEATLHTAQLTVDTPIDAETIAMRKQVFRTLNELLGRADTEVERIQEDCYRLRMIQTSHGDTH